MTLMGVVKPEPPEKRHTKYMLIERTCTNPHGNQTQDLLAMREQSYPL